MRISNKLIPTNKELIGFAWVGAIGFFIDASVLSALIIGYGWNHYAARLLSFGTAVSVTWYLNRRWTFSRQATQRRGAEYRRYLAVQTIGALVNFGIYSACIAASHSLANIPVIPLALGSGVAMIFNLLAAKRFVYTKCAEAARLHGG